MSNIIEEFVISLGLDNKQLKKGLDDASKTVDGGLKKIAAGFSAAFVAAKIGQTMHEFVGELSEINKLAKSVDMSVEALETWRGAAREFGADAENFGQVFSGLNDSMQQAVLKNRGVLKKFVDQGILPELQDANGQAKDTQQYLLEIADTLKGMDTRTASAILKDITGVSDIDTIEFLQQGSAAIREQIEAASKLPHFTDENVKAAKEFEKAEAKLSNSIKMLFLPVFEALIGPMTKFTDFCTYLARHIKALTPALLVLAGILAKSFLPAIQGCLTALRAMFLTPAGALMIALIAIGLLLEDIYNWLNGEESKFGEYYQAIADAFNSIANAVKQTFDDLVEALKILFNALCTAVLALWQAWKDGMSAVIDGFFTVVEGYVNTIMELWEAMTSLLSGDFDGAIEHIKAAFNSFFGIFKSGIDWIFEKLGALANMIPGLSTIAGKISGFFGGSAGAAVPAAAGNSTNNTTNITNEAKFNIAGSVGEDQFREMKGDSGQFFNSNVAGVATGYGGLKG